MTELAFKSFQEFDQKNGGYQFLPFRFARVPGVENKVLLTSEVGEFVFLSETQFSDFAKGNLAPDDDCSLELEAKHFLFRGEPVVPIRLLAAKYRTKKSYLKGGPALHIFVVSLRCDHSCSYCQVSRQSADRANFDMSDETVLLAVDRLFECPSPHLTVEFQGGEPLLAFPTIKKIVEEIETRNEQYERAITFTITTTLHHVTEDILAFFAKHNFEVSTSLDGSAVLHNANRPLPTRNSHDLTLAGLQRARDALGTDKVAALTTLTSQSLQQPEAIIDEYVRLGFKSIFLRPLSPYGFAIRSQRKTGYPMEDYVAFYKRALAYILKLNAEGVELSEAYTSILLSHMLTPFPSQYVDLRSPTGAALGALVYNYDGTVYASDEGRMLAEMGDTTFCLGRVSQPYNELMRSEAVEILLASGVAESLPGCSDCAFLPYCGADPIHTYATQGDPVGHRATSDHCRRHMGMFNILFKYLADADPTVMRTFLAWINHKSTAELDHSLEVA